MPAGNDICTTRALASEDWRLFSELRLEGLQKYPQFFGSNYARESAFTEADWQGWLSNPKGKMFGLFCSGNAIGITGILTAQDDPSGQTAMMIASYIKPEYQGRGLSTKLYQARIEWAVAHSSFKAIRVGHRDGNESSRRANQRHGFTFVQRIAKTWPDGTDGDECVYELNLETRRQKL